MHGAFPMSSSYHCFCPPNTATVTVDDSATSTYHSLSGSVTATSTYHSLSGSVTATPMTLNNTLCILTQLLAMKRSANQTLMLAGRWSCSTRYTLSSCQFVSDHTYITSPLIVSTTEHLSQARQFPFGRCFLLFTHQMFI